MVLPPGEYNERNSVPPRAVPNPEPSTKCHKKSIHTFFSWERKNKQRNKACRQTHGQTLPGCHRASVFGCFYWSTYLTLKLL